MRTRVFIILTTLALIAVASYVLYEPIETSPRARGGNIDVTQALGGEALEGYARATTPRAFTFPLDHGPHPAFRNEWWYFTGHLENSEGQRFGFELTFFRIALTPQTFARSSPWATNQVYMGHFAITDVTHQRFYYYERFARDALGLASAKTNPVSMWLEDWSIRFDQTHPPRWQLHAKSEGQALTLTLIPRKPVVLQGDRGLSRKSNEPGNASYYYSITRLDAQGQLTLEGNEFTVQGSAWLDREWSTSALTPEQAGWDWLALQLADGEDVMVYQIRRRDGDIDPNSQGILVDAEGHTTPLTSRDFTIEVREWWQSPRGGRYPARVHLIIKSADLDLEIVPLMADQELNVSVRYWEGAIEVIGRRGGRPIHGRGYMELTGYSDAPLTLR